MKPKTQSEARSRGLEGQLEGRLVIEGHLKICWGRAYLISTLSLLHGVVGLLVFPQQRHLTTSVLLDENKIKTR